MNHRYFIIISALLALFILFSCNNNSKKNKTDSDQNQSTDFEKLVQNWNDAHNTSDIEYFKSMYDENVDFYKTELKGVQCAEKKQSLLQKYDDFKQTIGKITIEKQNKTTVKCSFIKTSIVNGNSFEYPSYLIFTKTDKGWKISAESDLITDENIEKLNLSSVKVSGDFNSDGAPEYMWVNKPRLIEEEYQGECVGDCTCYIEFSDKKIPNIKVENCIGGTPVNEGDLNDDGSDEIGLSPAWWSSCWNVYFVYTLKNGVWQYLVDPISTHCNQWDEGVDVISKTPGKKGYVTINYSDMTDDGIVTKSKIVKVE